MLKQLLAIETIIVMITKSIVEKAFRTFSILKNIC